MVDFREWLDAVDERGLIPAGEADPAYADNLTDLDFAQNLLDEFGITSDLAELQLRSEAAPSITSSWTWPRPLGAPHAVRKDMDDWNFERAMARIEQSTSVYEALTEADRLLPEAALRRSCSPSSRRPRTRKSSTRSPSGPSPARGSPPGGGPAG